MFYVHFGPGRFYEGDWTEDEMHGDGKLIDDKGNVYSGTFKKGYFFTKLTFENGDVYEG